MDALGSRLVRVAKLTRTRGIVYWHQRAQWEYKERSRYGIWIGEYSSHVIMIFAQEEVFPLLKFSVLTLCFLPQIWRAAFGDFPSSIFLLSSLDLCFHLTTKCHWVWNQTMMFLYSEFYVNKCDTARNRQQQTWLATQALKCVTSSLMLLFYIPLSHDLTVFLGLRFLKDQVS